MRGVVNPGDVLDGKYRVERVLGEGGMGIVVSAHHLKLDEKVAIKFLLPSALSSDEIVARFDREARAAVKIKSEHVARAIDVGTLADGAPYMVMEYLEGIDLAAWLKQRGPLPVTQAVEFVLQACEAIAEAHALGIVHRDLKPANLFVVRRADGLLSVKVLDFGISKLVDRDGSTPDMSLTRTATVMGSPLYMSPEQMESSRSVDSRTDIWALGVILYELVTGRVPFIADTMPELVIRIIKDMPPPLRDSVPDAPPELEAVIANCLEKDRSRRYPNVGRLAVSLVDFAPRRSRNSIERITRTIQTAGLSQSVIEGPASESKAPAPAASRTASSWGRTLSGTGKGPAAAALGSAAVVLALGVHWSTRSSSGGAPHADPSRSPVSTVAPVVTLAPAVATDTPPAAPLMPPPTAPTSAPAPAPSVAARRQVQAPAVRAAPSVRVAKTAAMAPRLPTSPPAAKASTKSAFDDRE